MEEGVTLVPCHTGHPYDTSTITTSPLVGIPIINIKDQLDFPIY